MVWGWRKSRAVRRAQLFSAIRMSDSRYRGVYFLLADLMPITKAETLREKLINYAADSGDNTVANTFVRKLRARKKP